MPLNLKDPPQCDFCSQANCCAWRNYLNYPEVYDIGNILTKHETFPHKHFPGSLSLCATGQNCLMSPLLLSAYYIHFRSASFVVMVVLCIYNFLFLFSLMDTFTSNSKHMGIVLPNAPCCWVHFCGTSYHVAYLSSLCQPYYSISSQPASYCWFFLLIV